jgi:histidinol dehydrogenase
VPDRLKVKLCNSKELPSDWFKRTRIQDEKTAEALENDVKAIINEVRNNGDTALVEFAEKFDGAQLKPETLRVTQEEIQKAYIRVSDDEVKALKLMKDKVRAFEQPALKPLGTATSQEGITIQTMLFPLESVGCYIPGGQAAYPSTVVMTTVPAKVAGVRRIVVCSPPDKNGNINPLVLVAADVCEVDEVYKVGGAQAIAALAYGTDMIKPVRKIAGPGSKYVTMAKVLVSNDVAIDMPAGPSEVLVLADETANSKFVAADMISQAEHGSDSIAGLITVSQKLAEDVNGWLVALAGSAGRSEIVERALNDYGFVITCDTQEEMIALANAFAPEHLEIMLENPLEVVEKITSAGLILLGPYSPVALSDYASGTNHVLPTGGFAKSFSGLSALDFVRRVSVVDCSKEGLQELQKHVEVMTKAENLPNHYKAVEARFENEKGM